MGRGWRGWAGSLREVSGTWSSYKGNRGDISCQLEPTKFEDNSKTVMETEFFTGISADIGCLHQLARHWMSDVMTALRSKSRG